MTALPEKPTKVPVDGSVIQVRAALIGLLLSVLTGTVYPLFAVMLTVTILAIYSNGHFEDGPVTEGIS